MASTIPFISPEDLRRLDLGLFDDAVAACFPDNLHRSIPGYAAMRKLVVDLGSRYVTKGSEVVDLGCSDGLGLEPFVSKFGALVRFRGYDNSAPMLTKAREKFAGLIDSRVMRIEAHDLCDGYPVHPMASLTLSVLTLQFVPVEFRQALLRQAYMSLLPGGAMIVTEKILGGDFHTTGTFAGAYRNYKLANGYSAEEVNAKSLSLEGVLTSWTAQQNEDALRKAGFESVECFWRYLNFAGWLAVKCPGPTSDVFTARMSRAA